MTLVLKPLPKWSGQVLSPEGLPVKQFHVQAAPLQDPWVRQVIVRDCTDPEGRFTLACEQPGPHWLAIQAAGHAAQRHGRRSSRWTEEPEFTGRTPRTRSERYGTRLRAPSETARGAGGSEAGQGANESSSGVVFHSTAEVVDEAMQRVAERTTTLDGDGRFQIEHVRSGIYGLEISGPGITAGTFWIGVAADDVERRQPEDARDGADSRTGHRTGRRAKSWPLALCPGRDLLPGRPRPG